MTGLQVAFTVVSAMATFVIALSTYSFHRWSKLRHFPDPILANKEVELEGIDEKQARVRVKLTFLNVGMIPIFVDRLSLGLQSLKPFYNQGFVSGQGEISSGQVKSFETAGEWERTDLQRRREIVVSILFRVGTRTGELIYRGLKSPATSDLEALEEGGIEGPVKFLRISGRPDAASIPACSFTYPSMAIGRFVYKLRRLLKQTPIQKFARWCEANMEIEGHKPWKSRDIVE